MGKTKKEKGKGKDRLNPTGLVSVEEAARIAEETAATHHAPILQKLDSADQEERENTCEAIAILALEGETERSALLRGGALKLLSKRLLDPSLAVRCCAAGALTNFAISGGAEVCERMVSDDVLATLINAVTQALTAHRAAAVGGDKDAQRREECVDVLHQSLQLMSLLVEGSDRATQILNASDALGYLFECIAMIKDLPMVAHYATHCLHSFTDRNPPAAEGIRASVERQQLVTALLTSGQASPHLKALAAGIMYNVRSAETTVATCAHVLPPLLSMLSYDVAGSLAALAPQLAHADEDLGESRRRRGEDGGSSEPTAAVTALKEWKGAAMGQKVALEILANMAVESTGDASETPTMGTDDEMTMEEEGEAEMEGDGEYEDVTLSAELTALFDSNGVLSKVLSTLGALSQLHTSQPIASALTAASTGAAESMVSLASECLLRATSCAGNLISSLDVPRLGDVSSLWSALCTFVGATASLTAPMAQHNQQEMLEAATAAMWALLRTLNKAKRHDVPVVSTAQLDMLVGLAKSCPHEEVRTAAVGVLGALGVRPHSLDHNRALGCVLLECCGDASLIVVAEALNAIFDIYGESDYDQVFASLDFGGKLVQLNTTLAARIRDTKGRMDRDAHSHVQEAKLNLARFIKYKQKNIRA